MCIDIMPLSGTNTDGRVFDMVRPYCRIRYVKRLGRFDEVVEQRDAFGGEIVFGKIAYGAVAEAAPAGTVLREGDGKRDNGDWPEEMHLIDGVVEIDLSLMMRDKDGRDLEAILEDVFICTVPQLGGWATNDQTQVTRYGWLRRSEMWWWRFQTVALQPFA
jgi:hypothetical protein